MDDRKSKACLKTLFQNFPGIDKANRSMAQQAGLCLIIAIAVLFTACSDSSPVSSNDENGVSEPAVIQNIVITPESASVEVGETQQFTATVYDQRGDVMQGETITWSSDDESVANVNASGLATSVNEGTAAISANAGSVSHAATVTVSNPVQSGAWQAVGAGMNDDVMAFTEFEGDLVAGGRFTTADGQTAVRVARWDGSDWHSMGTVGEPVNSQAAVHTLTVFNGDLIAGGGFITADGQTVNNIARWDGSNWQTMGDGMDNAVLDLTVFEDDLIAVGMFRHSGGERMEYVARWNGTEWQSMAIGMNGSVSAVEVFGSDLIIGGVFRNIAGQAATRIARWDGSAWHPMGSLGDPDDFNEGVEALKVFENDLIAGGRFETADGREVNNVARWDGSGWQPMDSGTSSDVRALTTLSGDLIGGGDFLTASGVEVRRTARWDGSNWQPMGSGLGSQWEGSASAYALIAFNDNLFVGGFFTSNGSGEKANNVARWEKP